MLSSSELAARMQPDAAQDEKALSVVPQPDLAKMEDAGAASIDLRLGRWFRTLKPARTHFLGVSFGSSKAGPDESPLTREHFVPFGQPFLLHPHNFVLGITLEWIRLPADLGGYVTGKSSLGRRGLIIETAAGLQPGFSGCLALELSNVGEVPIELHPGMSVCQIFLHHIEGKVKAAKSQFAGRRKPILGSVSSDVVLNKLRASI